MAVIGRPKGGVPLAGFDPGAKISVEHATPDGYLDVVISRVERIWQGHLHVTDPDPTSPQPPFPAGAWVLGRVDDVTHFILSRVQFLGRDQAGVLVFTAPEFTDRYPKRRYFRFAADLRLIVLRNVCRAVDLSGSGLLAVCPGDLKIQEGNLVRGYLSLPTEEFRLDLRVVRIHPAPEGTLYVAFDFEAISEQHRDKIITYLLDRQRQRMRWIRLR